METYIIRVNGTEYEVEVEKKGSASSRPAAAQKEAAPAPEAPKKAAGGGVPVVCGTSGKVFKIAAKEGDSVRSGDTVLILEAMKMEIPVVSPKDGTVSRIVVSEGDSVASGQSVAFIA